MPTISGEMKITLIIHQEINKFQINYLFFGKMFDIPPLISLSRFFDRGFSETNPVQSIPPP